MQGKRTLTTLLVDLSYWIGKRTPVLNRWAAWRVLWQATILSWLYRRIKRPFFNGVHWVDLS